MRLQRLVAALALPSILLLTGCDTEEELLKQRFEILKAEETSLQGLKVALSPSNDPLEGPGKVSLFLSVDTINEVLKGADGAIVNLAEVKSASVKVNSIRTDFRLGYPLLSIDATARKEGSDAELTLVGVARLLPKIIAQADGKPTLLEIKIYVESLVPRAKWGWFEFEIGGFIRDLAQVKLSDEFRTVGVIRIPVDTDIPLNVQAKQTPAQFPGANATISTPDLSINGKATIEKVIVLPDGLHVYGKASMATGA